MDSSGIAVVMGRGHEGPIHVLHNHKILIPVAISINTDSTSLPFKNMYQTIIGVPLFHPGEVGLRILRYWTVHKSGRLVLFGERECLQLSP